MLKCFNIDILGILLLVPGYREIYTICAHFEITDLQFIWIYVRKKLFSKINGKLQKYNWGAKKKPHTQDIQMANKYVKKCSILLMIVCELRFSHVWLFRNPMGCSLPDSSVHGISQAGILEWVGFPPPGNLQDFSGKLQDSGDLWLSHWKPQ